MKFFRYLSRGLDLVFTSMSLVIGLIVGVIFGLLASLLVLASIDGYSFSSQSIWHLAPGVILGALAGVKGWPLMLGLFLGGAEGVSEASLPDSFAFGSSDAPDSGPAAGGQSGGDEQNNRGAW